MSIDSAPMPVGSRSLGFAEDFTGQSRPTRGQVSDYSSALVGRDAPPPVWQSIHRHRATRLCAPGRLITAFGNLAPCSAPVFQTSVGKDGLI
jgi:hypothetical protein